MIIFELAMVLVATVTWAFFLCWIIQLFPHKSTFPSISAGMGGQGRRTPYRWESKVTQAIPLFVGPFVLMVLAVLLAEPSWRGLVAVLSVLGRIFMH